MDDAITFAGSSPAGAPRFLPGTRRCRGSLRVGVVHVCISCRGSSYLLHFGEGKWCQHFCVQAIRMWSIFLRSVGSGLWSVRLVVCAGV
jgi:hypothetical protein